MVGTSLTQMWRRWESLPGKYLLLAKRPEVITRSRVMLLSLHLSSLVYYLRVVLPQLHCRASLGWTAEAGRSYMAFYVADLHHRD